MTEVSASGSLLKLSSDSPPEFDTTRNIWIGTTQRSKVDTYVRASFFSRLYLLAHLEMSPRQSSMSADVLVELETGLGPLVHSWARGCGPVRHGGHQTNTRYLEHLDTGGKKVWNKNSVSSELTQKYTKQEG